jgi:TetR/AcrR family transcriptional repressor of bet genes
MARPKNTDARRAQIVDGFLRVMAQRGYDGAAMSAVAEAAELTPGLIHYHFTDKEAVLVAAVEVLGARHLARLDAALAAAGARPGPQLTALIDAHLGLGAHADPEALACWLAMGAEATRRPAVAAPYRAVMAAVAARVRAVVDAGVAAKRWAPAEPEAAATAILAAIQGYFALAAAAPGLIPRGSAARAVAEMAQGVLRAKRPLPARRPA